MNVDTADRASKEQRATVAKSWKGMRRNAPILLCRNRRSKRLHESDTLNRRSPEHELYESAAENFRRHVGGPLS